MKDADGSSSQKEELFDTRVTFEEQKLQLKQVVSLHQWTQTITLRALGKHRNRRLFRLQLPCPKPTIVLFRQWVFALPSRRSSPIVRRDGGANGRRREAVGVHLSREPSKEEGLGTAPAPCFLICLSHSLSSALPSYRSLDWQDLETTLVTMQQELQKMHVQNAKSEQERRRDSQMFYDILASRDQELRVINQ